MLQGGQTWTCQQVVVSFANRCHRSRCHQHRLSAEAASEEVVLCPLPILRLAIAVTFQGKLLLKPLIKMWSQSLVRGSLPISKAHVPLFRDKAMDDAGLS